MEQPTLPPLRHAVEADIPAILELADLCVGAGLYTKEDLEEVFAKDSPIILAQEDADGILIGYYFGYLTTGGEASKLMKFSPEQEAEVFPDLSVTVGICKSIGISPRARGHRLGFLLQSTATEVMMDAGAAALYGVAWRKDGVVVMDHMLAQLGFTYLFDTQKVWYDVEGLDCPVCKQAHCVCPAAIYRKEGLSHEN